MDPILSQDIALFTMLAAHIGLTIGTLSRHLKRRPDFKPLVQRLLRFDTVGIYLLTERGHGLDAFNIETTATKTADGYILHTPREEAAKCVTSLNVRIWRLIIGVGLCQHLHPHSKSRRSLSLWPV